MPNDAQLNSAMHKEAQCFRAPAQLGSKIRAIPTRRTSQKLSQKRGGAIAASLLLCLGIAFYGLTPNEDEIMVEMLFNPMELAFAF